MTDHEDLSTEDLKNEQLLRELYKYQNYKQTELAEVFDTYRGKIRKKLKEYDIVRAWEDEELLRKTYVENGLSTVDLAKEWNTGHQTILNWLEKHGIETRESNRDKLPHHRIDDRGYEMILTYDRGKTRYMYVHRLLAVAEFGIEAVKDHDVHHKNGIKWDNRPENLDLLTHEEHGRIHGKEYKPSEDTNPQKLEV